MPLDSWQRQCLVLCGHSLGGVVVSLAAVLLCSHLPKLADTNTDLIKVVAFAPLPVSDHNLAIAASSYTYQIG
jgi:hypothetical protein